MTTTERPKIVCLCGSTKFLAAFDAANRDETLNGNIVLSVGVDLHHRDKPVLRGLTEDQEKDLKGRLDRLHKEKIRLADEILVINVNGYVGPSTQGEIELAEKSGKPIRYLVDR
jgi:hypothetical protein